MINCPKETQMSIMSSIVLESAHGLRLYEATTGASPVLTSSESIEITQATRSVQKIVYYFVFMQPTIVPGAKETVCIQQTPTLCHGGRPTHAIEVNYGQLAYAAGP